jgi:hypothetical protein
VPDSVPPDSREVPAAGVAGAAGVDLMRRSRTGFGIVSVRVRVRRAKIRKFLSDLISNLPKFLK